MSIRFCWLWTDHFTAGDILNLFCYAYIFKRVIFVFPVQLITIMFWNAFFEGAILKNTYVQKTTYVLKWMNNLFKIFGCWLVWLLLYIFMAADLYFLSKFSPQVKLTCINTSLRCIKYYELLWIKQTDGLGLCFNDQYEALQISRKNCRFPGRPW